MPPLIAPIKGMPGYYISTLGEVWSRWRLRRRSGGGRGTESYVSRVMKPVKLRKHNQGYLAVALRKDGKYVYFLVHRLVLETFVGSCPEGMEGCHRNGNKHDNNLENVYWGTRQTNMEDSIRLDQVAHGERNSRAKLTEEQAKEAVALLDAGWSQQQVADKFGISQTQVGHIHRGIAWHRVTGRTPLRRPKRRRE